MHLCSVALPGRAFPGPWDEGAAVAQSVPLAPHRPSLASTQLTSFFGALDSVLRYRATVLQAFKDMDRFTVNVTVLSTRDVLLLLHKWSLIERDVRLQEDLRAAVEKHQDKELLSECQDPRLSRPPGCSLPPEQCPSLSEQHFQSRGGFETGPAHQRSPSGGARL